MSSRPTRRPARRPAHPSYHHGALRAALIDAATAILAEGGVEAFTLRECARRASVSHAAPAHHFGDARGLLSACAEQGFERLAGAMEQRLLRAGASPEDRVRSLGQGYIEFALQQRALFQLMFRRDRLDPQHEGLRRAGRRVGDLLRDAIDTLMAARGLAADERGQRILLTWSVVHGYATLVLEEQCTELYGLSAAQPRAAGRAGDELLRLLLGGLAAPAYQ